LKLIEFPGADCQTYVTVPHKTLQDFDIQR